MLQNSLMSTKRGAKSCGCLQHESAGRARQDLAGRTFGRLTVMAAVELDEPTQNRVRTGWICRCECGTEHVYTTKQLVNNGKLSCGCLIREAARHKTEDLNVLGRYDGTVASAIRPDRAPNKNNKSGHKGVYWHKTERRWIAKITVRGQSITLGRFAEIEDAVTARKAAEAKYFAPIIEAWQAEHGE